MNSRSPPPSYRIISQRLSPRFSPKPLYSPMKTVAPKKQAKFEESVFEKYKGMDILSLRAEKAKCVKSMDFDEAEIIDEYLKRSNTDNSDKVIGEYSEWLRKGIDDLCEKYSENVREIENEAKNSEIELRKHADGVFREDQRAHIEELTQIEVERKISLMKMEKRDTADFNDLSKQARKFAAANDFDSARKVLAAADARKQADKADGEISVNKRYDTISMQICSRQKGDLDVLQGNLEKQLATAAAKKETDLRNQLVMARNYITSSLQRAVREASEKIEAKDKKKDIIKTLNGAVRDYLKEKGMLQLIE